jgi:N-acetylglucosaminyl-diphospho-decaprenol L-rhamnosyltransferase
MNATDVIILDIDGGERLQRCVNSLAAQTVKPARVIILDNGSADPVGRRLRKPISLRFDLMHSDVNLGFTGGVNRAMTHVTSPYVALVNNDVELDADWLATLTAALDGTPAVAAAQTIIRRDSASVDGAGIDISDGTYRQVGHGAPLTGALPRAWGVSATATLYRVDATGREIFDDRFFAYYEDVELCARLRREGWDLLVVPEAKATHEGSASAGKLGARARYLRTRNRYWVARMHPGVGRITALLAEDARLALRGRTSVRGIVDGLRTTLG